MHTLLYDGNIEEVEAEFYPVQNFDYIVIKKGIDEYFLARTLEMDELVQDFDEGKVVRFDTGFVVLLIKNSDRATVISKARYYQESLLSWIAQREKKEQ